MSDKQLFEIYENKIEKIDTQLGFSLTAKRIKNGWIVFKWYSRNYWVDDKLERKILFTDFGKIFENNKLIGTFKTESNGTT